MNDKIKENLLDQSCAPTDNLQSNWDRIDWTKAELAVEATSSYCKGSKGRQT